MEKQEDKIQHLMQQSGYSRATVYRYAQRLKRLPTVEELKKGVKKGRPSKYN